MGFFDDKQDWLAEVFSMYPPEGRRSAVMPMLRKVQEHEGYISPERQQEIARKIPRLCLRRQTRPCHFVTPAVIS
ncbi:MAG: NAD(P)H-dependent oxidoreductase subunit E [Deinococcus sp.]|nr:NAD(P)H-dependent oxidoreductase subunit E [Deinococcus sp.]